MDSGKAGPRVEVDGRVPTPEQLTAAALDAYGHFTSMQVRSGQTRGLGLHLTRLAAAHRELFETELDEQVVAARIRHALGADTPDASVRVYLRQSDGQPSITVTVRPPGAMPATPWRLHAVPYQRAVAHIKHLGDFGQGYFQRQAWRNGFDEALLTSVNGVISEGSITNIGFFDGTSIVWPDAPMLAGITMQLLESRIADVGLTARRAPIMLSDVPSFDGVFVTNARGIAAVAEVDGTMVRINAGLMAQLTKAYDSVRWDRV